MTQREALSAHLLSGARIIIYTLVFLLPLFVLSFPIEPLELNKQTLFIVLSGAATLCWLGSMFTDKKFKIKKGWINLLPIILLTGFTASALQSTSEYISWFGGSRQEYTSVLTIAAGTLLFYTIVNIFGERKQHKQMHAVMLASATIVALLATIETLGGGVLTKIHESIFYTVGPLSSLVVYLVVINSFFITSWVCHKKKDSLLFDQVHGLAQRFGIFVILLSTIFFLFTLDYTPVWLLFAGSMFWIFVTAFFRANDIQNKKRLWIPAIFGIFAVIAMLWLPGVSRFQLPLEVSVNAESSSIIAQSTLKTYSSTYGTGPGTYSLDYAEFHTQGVNETEFWNTNFDRASSFVMTLLPTIGIFGTTLAAVFVGLMLVLILPQITRAKSRDQWLENFIHLSSWLTLVASAFLVSWNMTLVMLLFLLSGLLAAQIMKAQFQKSLTKPSGASILFSITLVGLMVVFVAVVFLTTQRYMAELAFSRAVEIDRDGGKLDEIITQLDRAATLNSKNDTYFRSMGETLILSFAEEVKQIDSIDTLSIESTKYLQSITAAGINALIKSTELSPRQVSNWLSLGFAYKELVPVMGHQASLQAISSYQTATELEPLNPSHWTQLGKAHLVSAQEVKKLTLAVDEDIANNAKEKLTEVITSAENSFLHAIELKSNYAPAHFQLAVVFDEAGRLDDAIGKMESVAQYNQFDVGVFFELGMYYLKRLETGDMERAQAALERSTKLAPTFSNAHWFLASIYEQQGDISAAVAQIEKVLEINPGNEIVETRLNRLLTGKLNTEIPEALEE
jgi:tetratricopeptide (TPR) repeat protein